MKKLYQQPEINMLTLAKEDVLNSSGNGILPTFVDLNDNYVADDFALMVTM